jgi:hypothetical protein
VPVDIVSDIRVGVAAISESSEYVVQYKEIVDMRPAMVSVDSSRDDEQTEDKHERLPYDVYPQSDKTSSTDVYPQSLSWRESPQVFNIILDNSRRRFNVVFL